MSAIVVRPPPADGTLPRRIDRWLMAGPVRRRWIVAVFGACAVVAGATALLTVNRPHRIWGVVAVGAYGLAALAALAWKSRGVELALLIAITGAVAAPLFWMASTGQAQPEVAVTVRSAKLLVRHGDPYQSPAQIAATHNPNSYNPYLPALTVFGLPRALGLPRPIADPRLWFGLSFAVVLMLALVRARAPDPWRWTALIIATPAIALPIAVGGTDLPVLALICLGLALLRAEPKPVAAGLALGAAAAMKATAWPALIVAAALLAGGGRWRSMAKLAGTAVAVCAVVIVPFALLWPQALVQNTIMFPLGLTRIRTPATSPLPGHLLAGAGHAGYLIAIAALGLAAVALAGSLVLPPARHADRGCLPPRARPGADVRTCAGYPMGILRLPGGPLRLGLAGQQAQASSQPAGPGAGAGGRGAGTRWPGAGPGPTAARQVDPAIRLSP